MDWPATIRERFEAGAVLYTSHARLEMREEEFGPVTDQELYEAMRGSEVLAEYPDDKPYPSVLVFGKTEAGRPIHAVCAYVAEEQVIVVVTVYQPDPRLWEDYRRRKL